MYSFGRTKRSFSVHSCPGIISAHLPIQPDVEDIGFGAIFWPQDADAVGSDHFCNVIVRVFHIADLSRAERACLHAGRLQPLGYAVIAERAFLCGVIHGMEEPGAVRARHDAVAAADAPCPVDENNTVRGLEGGADGADLHAGWLVTLVAELRDKEGLVDLFRFDGEISACILIDPGIGEAVAAGLWRISMKSAVLGQHVSLHPGTRGAGIVGDLVLQFAGLYAKPATDALVGIDQKHLSLIHISEPTRLGISRMPSSA